MGGESGTGLFLITSMDEWLRSCYNAEKELSLFHERMI